MSMKFKTTKKAVTNGYYKIIGLGYCSIQSMLYYKNPIAYTCGIYGWNCDIYEIKGIAIMTGYRGMTTKNMKNPNYELLKEYEQKAADIIDYTNKIEYDKKRELMDELLIEFLNKCEL